MKTDWLLPLASSAMLALIVVGFPPQAGFGKDDKVDVSRLRGRIQFVENFPDFRVKVTSSFPDLNVQIVESFPDAPGKWQVVDSFPDYKVQLVDSFPDFTIKYVDSFPGPAK